MTATESRPPAEGRRGARVLLLLAGLAFATRAAAAFAVQRIADRRGTLCLFPDADIYWLLAGAIRAGRPFEVSQWGIPHRALRTPGYPLFLAAGQALFGPEALPIRLVQAALGAGCVVLVALLVRRVDPSRRGATAALVAAAMVALDPYLAGLSVVLLSEGVFVPLMLAGLWGLAALWAPPGGGGPRRGWLGALATGAAQGAAVLVKPSWGGFVPLILVAWVAAPGPGRGRRREALGLAAVVALGAAAVLAPWWVRNARTFGRFVPTALWAGASLYDGLNPSATGASDLSFLADDPFRPLGEEAQDAELSRRALAFVRDHPGRALRLAAIKAGRFWSPWPNEAGFRSPGAVALGVLVVLPCFALMLLGGWDRRRDARALALLAGPILYLAALHVIFVGSIRYRIPGSAAAAGLAGLGAARWVRRGAEGR